MRGLKRSVSVEVRIVNPYVFLQFKCVYVSISMLTHLGVM